MTLYEVWVWIPQLQKYVYWYTTAATIDEFVCVKRWAYGSDAFAEGVDYFITQKQNE